MLFPYSRLHSSSCQLILQSSFCEGQPSALAFQFQHLKLEDMDVGVVMEQEGASLIRMVSKFSLDFPLSGQTIIFTIIICKQKKH